MYLSDKQIAGYVASLTPEQAESIRTLRALVQRLNPTLMEEIVTGKWLTGLLQYKPVGGPMIFALGPKTKGRSVFHMMPLYGSVDLQARHTATLKPWLTGKSCITFRRVGDVPFEALEDIVSHVPEVLRMLQDRR